MGTPETAVPFLDFMCREHPPALVITMPDRPAGRGLKLTPSPVKVFAAARGIPVETADNSAAVASALQNVKPDVAVVVAYGRLLKQDALSVPAMGCLNIHFSLLPAYRGAAPVQWALINGETETGVSAFWLDEGMDTGPLCLAKRHPIAPEDNAASLMSKLAAFGVDILDDALELSAAGSPPRIAQSGKPSAAPLLRTEDSFLDFSRPAAEIHNRVRGLALGPRARVYCPAGGRKTLVQVLKTSLSPAGAGGAPGTIARVERGRGFIVECSDGAVLVESVRPEGKNTVSAWDFANGLRLKAGDVFALPCAGRADGAA